MSGHFDKAILGVLGHEGGYQCDPDDSGNWTGGKCGVGELKGTKYGIAAASYPSLDIKNITVETAKNIYRAAYWHPHFNELDYSVAAKCFDIAVNCGPKTAAMLLQRACGVKDDGKIGPVTMAAAKSIPADELLDRICNEQRRYYQRIVEIDHRKGKYLMGWLKRAGWKPVA